MYPNAVARSIMVLYIKNGQTTKLKALEDAQTDENNLDTMHNTTPPFRVSSVTYTICERARLDA